MRNIYKCLLGFSLILLLCPSSQADVRDGGGFFSPDAIRQANTKIGEINKSFGKDLVIETHPSVPGELQPQLQQLGQKDFYTQWLTGRAEQLGLDGVLVLITKNPPFIQVGQGGETAKQAFTTEDRNRLRDGLIATFRDRKYDDGLLRAVNFVHKTFESRGPAGAAQARTGAPAPTAGDPAARTPAQAPAQGGGGISIMRMLMWGILLLIGISFIRRMFARRQAMRGPPPLPGGGYGGYGPRQQHPQAGYGHPQQQPGPHYGQEGYPQQQRGGMGGMGSGLGGGLLGGLAGGWLYDRMFRRDHGQNAGWGTTDPARHPDQGGDVFTGDDRGRDFASSGGSFGDDAGGGGDAGGGDSGGDSGGGSF